MNLESLKVGRMYLVKQGKKLLNLRLLKIQSTTRRGTDLYECKTTITGYQLWMMDERIGKGYTIRNFAQIQEEVKERPKKDSLVQIVSGKLLKTLGSITVYRVADVKRDEQTHEWMVELYGDFKNYLLPMSDVKVYESTGIDPESLLSKESKAIGDMPRKVLPTSTRTKKGLLDFVTLDVPFGSMSDEVIMTKEEREAEEKEEEEKESRKKAQKELDKKKADLKPDQEDGSWQQEKKTRKKGQNDLAVLASGIMLPTKKQPVDKVARAREVKERRMSKSKNGSKTNSGNKDESQSTKKGLSSTAHTASVPSSTKSDVPMTKGKGKSKLDAFVKTTITSTSEEREGEDRPDPIEQQKMSLMPNTDSDGVDSDEDDTKLEGGGRPAHLADVKIPMVGGQIAESYFENLPKKPVMKKPMTTKQMQRRTGH